MRSYRNMILCGLLGGLLLTQTLYAQNKEAAGFFTQGQAALAQGDFDAALKLYAQAARGEPANMAYRENYSILRQVIKMRESLDKETNSAKWEYTAKALRAFYRNSFLFKESLPIDQKFYDLKQDGDSAELLAEAHLELNQLKELQGLLATLPQEKTTPGAKLIQAIALARLQQKDEALKLAQGVTMPQATDFYLCYYQARIQALTGQSDAALQSLTTAFENTPPSYLATLKKQAQLCADLKCYYDKDKPVELFAKALLTESKIKESACTGGGDCSTCRSKGSCESAGASAPAKQ